MEMSAEINARAHSSSFLIPHVYPGRLIAAEGLDGSGKSTQLRLLQFWLQAEGYEVVSSKLTPSKLIKRALKAGKKQGSIDPMLLSILHAADFAELYEREILPALKRGAVVLADRYIYTAFARDAARGIDNAWVHNLYRHSVQPDVVFYLHISPEEAVQRRLALQQLRLEARHKKEGQGGKQGKKAKDKKGSKKDAQDSQDARQQNGLSTTVPTTAPPSFLAEDALESFRNFEMRMSIMVARENFSIISRLRSFFIVQMVWPR